MNGHRLSIDVHSGVTPGQHITFVYINAWRNVRVWPPLENYLQNYRHQPKLSALVVGFGMVRFFVLLLLKMVVSSGLEPLTSPMSRGRATNYAKRRYLT